MSGIQAYSQSLDSSLIILDPLSIEQLNAEQRKQLDPSSLVYAKASALGDDPTAIVALHYLLQKDPQNPFFADSLAALYHRVGNDVACHRWCLEVLNQRPNAVFILQLAAVIEERRGDRKAALGHLEQVLHLIGGTFWRYKVAGLQFELGRYGEAGANVEAMLADSAIAEEHLYVTWENGGGIVPMQAALLNLRGNLEMALGKEGVARKSFKEALKLAPDFGLARNNLAALQPKQRSDEGGGQ